MPSTLDPAIRLAATPHLSQLHVATILRERMWALDCSQRAALRNVLRVLQAEVAYIRMARHDASRLHSCMDLAHVGFTIAASQHGQAAVAEATVPLKATFFRFFTVAAICEAKATLFCSSDSSQLPQSSRVKVVGGMGGLTGMDWH